MQPVPTSKDLPRFSTIMALGLLMLVLNAGCVRALANAIYVIKGRDNPAEFDGLIAKKVAILVSSNGVHTSDASNILLARNITLALQTKVKKIQMVSLDEIDRLIQTQQLGKVNPIEIGERVGADMVIDINIEDLKLYEGKTLYKGRSSVNVTTYQIKPTSEVVFRKMIPDFVFPQTGVPVTDSDEATFRRFYLMNVAERVARLFYPYDPINDFARDASAASFGM